MRHADCGAARWSIGVVTIPLGRAPLVVPAPPQLTATTPATVVIEATMRVPLIRSPSALQSRYHPQPRNTCGADHDFPSRAPQFSE
jgi:hypothetical protein